MKTLGWKASWAIAQRDLSGRFRGLRLLFVCLFLGVATLAAIGSLTASITGELTAKGRSLLGGDIEIAVSQREASASEKNALRALGTTSETIRMRAMAQREDTEGAQAGPAAVLTELKGVDGAYPLYGTLMLETGPMTSALAAGQLVIGRSLADRLDVTTGDMLRYGNADFAVAGIIADEPDRVGEGFTLGPVAIASLAGVRRTGLIQPGSLYESKYRIRIGADIDPQAAIERLETQFPSAGLEYRDRDRAAPGAFRFFERMGQFLSLIGLTALVIAGIGVGNGVSSYLTRKRSALATLKILGATSADVARIVLLQIGAVAVLAIGCGLVAGALLTPVMVWAVGDLLPVKPGAGLHPMPLATSAAYGLLIAFVFTLVPLARARTEPAAVLFRAVVERSGGIARRTVLHVAAAAAAIVALALVTARDPGFSAAVLGATAAVLAMLLAIGWAITKLAARVPRPRRPLFRLALANMHRPGAQTPALVIALGLALTLFVTLATIQTSLDAEIRQTVPERAPDQFVLDIPRDREQGFRDIVEREAPGAQLNVVPTLRGTIVAYGDQRVADLEDLPDGAWFLRGERGVTYSDTLPEGSDLLAGKWWPIDYSGPPLVSLDKEAADVMGVSIGDPLSVSILGREIDVRIASLRRVNWDTMGFNYIMVFSPNAVRDAPHTLAATIADTGNGEARVSRALLAEFPSISIIAVGEVIGQITGLLRQMSAAIVAAASVAILAGIAVLIGAIAASRQARSYDSVIIKTLGATRMQILGAQALEYGLLAAILASVSLALGALAGWSVIVLIFEFAWRPDYWVVLGTLFAGAGITLGIGLVGSIPLISVRPSQALRQL